VKERITGVQRLLRAIDIFSEKHDGEQIPVNSRGELDRKNFTNLLKELTAEDGDWRVRPDDRQNFYREELKSAMDILTERYRLSQKRNVDMDDVARSRIANVAKRAKEDREGAVEARAQYAAVLQRLNEAQSENARLRREIEGLRAQLDMVRSGFVPKVR